MKIDLLKEDPNIKQKVLQILIPAFREKEVAEMTNLPASTIGYYRRNYKIPTYTAKKKLYEQEAETEIIDTLEHNREFAKDRVLELCADNGIGYE
jgi:DNA-binding transcriptional MerR regulator